MMRGPRTGRIVVASLAAAVVIVAAVACGDEQELPHAAEELASATTEPTPAATAPTAAGTDSGGSAPVVESRPALSELALAGEELFEANCALCHGAKAAGTEQGPTLIDRIYHPGHHSDFSFRRAVAQGVPQHHWTFGAMLPVATVTADEVEQIICYIRELQRQHGIFEGDGFATVC